MGKTLVCTQRPFAFPDKDTVYPYELFETVYEGYYEKVYFDPAVPQLLLDRYRSLCTQYGWQYEMLDP